MLTVIWNFLSPWNVSDTMFHDWFVNILAWASAIFPFILFVGGIVFVFFWIRDIRDNFRENNNTNLLGIGEINKQIRNHLKRIDKK
jgi:hypothetical protein